MRINNTPLISYFFIVLLACGTVLLFYSLYYGYNGALFNFLQLIAIGLLLIGAGEWINHPLQESPVVKGEHSSYQKLLHRRRNPSSLGNLLEIGGLLFVFVGLAEML